MIVSTYMARRIGILAADQHPETPYAEARRFVKKTVAQFLIRRAVVEVISDELLREKQPKEAPYAGSVASNIDEHQRSTMYSPQRVHARNFSIVVKIPMPEPACNESLDLCYPEALRTTTVHPHAAMVEACRQAKMRENR